MGYPIAHHRTYKVYERVHPCPLIKYHIGDPIANILFSLGEMWKDEWRRRRMRRREEEKGQGSRNERRDGRPVNA